MAISIYTDYVLRDNLDWLRKKVEGLNRRARRLSLPTMQLVWDNSDVKRDQRDGLVYEYVKADLMGETPIIAGWQLVARVEHNNDPAFQGGNVVATVPGMKLPEEFRYRPAVCDHCKTSRQRNDTFILTKDQAEFKQVGRSCLKDFMGHISAAALIEWSKYEQFSSSMWNEARTNESRVRHAWHLPTVIATAIAVIEKHGWVSRQKAEEEMRTSTSSEVFHQLGNARMNADEIIKPTEDHEKMAEDIIEWGKTLSDRNDYEYNLGNVARSGVVPESLFGTTVSMVVAYKKAMDLLQKKAAKRPSEFVGKEKQRLTLKLRLANVWTFDSQYGVTNILKFYDEDDNIFVWKTGKDEGLERDKWYEVVGTVKEHSEFREEKQTVLTRCTVKEV